MTYTNFQLFLKIYLAVIVEIADLALRTVIDSFEIYTINSLTKIKFETNFIMSHALFGVAHSKQNEKNTVIIIIKGSSG